MSCDVPPYLHRELARIGAVPRLRAAAAIVDNPIGYLRSPELADGLRDTAILIEKQIADPTPPTPETPHRPVHGVGIHDLKTWPVYFRAVESGEKTFEIRRDDRGFAVGDMLHLREWTPPVELLPELLGPGGYTGRTLDRRITYILRSGETPSGGLKSGFVVMGIAAP